MLKKLFLSLFFLPLLVWSQHTISGDFKPASDFKMAILYKVMPMELVYANHSNVDSLGHFSIQLKKETEKGLYKIVYASPQEEYNFDVFYTGQDVELTFNLEQGVHFIKSEDNKLWQSYTKSMGMITDAIAKFYVNPLAKQDDFLTLTRLQEKSQEQFETATNAKFINQFIKASRTYYPSIFEDETTYKNNIKTHYFDALDFNNINLLNSDILIKKSLSYVFTYVNFEAANKSYIENIDTLISKIENQKAFKTVILKLLWNEFLRENETVANYITDTYLLDLAKAEKNTELVEQLLLVKTTSIGAKAPNFNISESSKFYDLDTNNNYLVVFWSSTCGHCLKELPQLHKIIDNTTKVIAIGLEDEPEFWAETIKQFPKFTHVYGKGKWENPIGNAYNVNSTPSYYLLGKNKTIIAKPYDVEALKTLSVKTVEK
jgi:thiol-disulfide isomerase/thioredoxin